MTLKRYTANGLRSSMRSSFFVACQRAILTLQNSKRYAEKVSMRKKIKAHEERNVKTKDVDALPEGALPAYLLDREGTNNAKALSTALKDKRKDKAGKFAVPLPKVRGIAEDEAFKVIKTGKRKQKGWKRLSVKHAIFRLVLMFWLLIDRVNKATFVGEGFTRKPVKMERFIRPMALRYKKANVTHRGSSPSLLDPS